MKKTITSILTVVCMCITACMFSLGTMGVTAANTLKGDISGNGKIDLYDAIEIAKSLVGTRTFNDEEKEIADFNEDGKVDLYDAIAIAKHLLNNSNNTNPEKNSDILVAYFSATGTTKTIAESIAKETGGNIFEIVPVQPYTSDDLNYNNDSCRANLEQNDDTARPEISSGIDNMDDYSTVFIGYPIWWGFEPRIIDTFMESYDLSGKTVIPFCTSGSSGISTSESNLKKMCPDAKWLDGKRFSGTSEVSEWIDKLNVK